MEKKPWAELSPGKRRAIVGLAIVEVALTAVAAVDLVRRPAEQVRGPKLAWAPVLLVQPIGPPAYLIFGRRS